jgi:heme/copper-type cytochrome/quinol oxidase subunit 2
MHSMDIYIADWNDNIDFNDVGTDESWKTILLIIFIVSIISLIIFSFMIYFFFTLYRRYQKKNEINLQSSEVFEN